MNGFLLAHCPPLSCVDTLVSPGGTKVRDGFRYFFKPRAGIGAPPPRVRVCGLSSFVPSSQKLTAPPLAEFSFDAAVAVLFHLRARRALSPGISATTRG